MSTTTKTFKFIKPALTDAADITAYNQNWDVIDQQLSIANKMFIAHSEDGVSYTATVDGATELYDGLTIHVLLDKLSASTAPTLNVNGLGDVRIGILSTVNNAAVVPPSMPTWLSANRPVALTYHVLRSANTGNIINTYWIVDWRRPSATDLYGSVPVQNGGTYINDNTTDEDIQNARTNLGITSGTATPSGGKHGDIYIMYEE